MTDNTQLRRQIINKIIGIEGGYVNDKADSGGATKYGITAAKAREFGFADVSRLSPDQAYDIYERGFWHPILLDDVLALDPMLAEEIFDTAVNTGKTQAIHFLQRALNLLNNNGQLWPDIVPDGLMGNATMGALQALYRKRGSRASSVLLNMLNAQQAEFYMSLAEKRPKDEKFMQGWQQNRVQTVVSNHDDAMQWQHDVPVAQPDIPQPKPVPVPAVERDDPPYFNDPRLDPDYRAWMAARERDRTSKPAIESKINWTQIIGIAAAWGVPMLSGMSAQNVELVGALLTTLQGAVTIILRTWFTDKTIRTGAGRYYVSPK